MRLTTQQMGRAIMQALEDEVLPTLAVRSWPASRVRSSLQMLQRIIDAAEYEADHLRTTAAGMRAFLEDPETRADTAALAAIPDVAQADLAAVRKAHAALQGLLTEAIRAAHDRRVAGGADDAPWRSRLHALLLTMLASENRLYAQAIHFLPM